MLSSSFQYSRCFCEPFRIRACTVTIHAIYIRKSILENKPHHKGGSCQRRHEWEMGAKTGAYTEWTDARSAARFESVVAEFLQKYKRDEHRAAVPQKPNVNCAPMFENTLWVHPHRTHDKVVLNDCVQQEDCSCHSFTDNRCCCAAALTTAATGVSSAAFAGGLLVFRVCSEPCYMPTSTTTHRLTLLKAYMHADVGNCVHVVRYKFETCQTHSDIQKSRVPPQVVPQETRRCADLCPP